MKLSACLTVHNRTPEVSEKVADSFRLDGNAPDELIVVMDRPTKEARDGAVASYDPLPFPVRFITIPGEPSWLCPARAWNLGFAACTGDLLYCISSEVIQAPGNLDKARAICADLDVVAFGACHNSEPTQLVTGFEPGLLASAERPRPLGFIACIPAKAMKAIGGCDEDFMNGWWYEDDDLYFRLWRQGLDFVFTDDLSGVHQHHERPVLETMAGQAGIARNQALMLRKHGTLTPWVNALIREERQTGFPATTIWRHP